MLQEFYRDVLPDTGYFCLTLLPEGRHLWVQSTEALAQLTERYASREGVYFGTAAFQSDESRKQDNVLGLRSLRLDIDAGAKKYAKDPDGTYPTQRDALAAFVGFTRSTGLAPSYVISSGEGLHVYYCLDETLAPDAWMPLADALALLVGQHNLRVDPTVTRDTARILRPIGGLHSEGKRVTTLKSSGLVYSVEALRAKLPVAAPTRKYDTSINDELDLTPVGPPSSAYKVATNCAALRVVAETRGDVQEPYWRAMIGLVKRTVEGLDVAQEWSSGYDGYDPDEVERKFNNWSTGPTTCAEFARHSDKCKTCEFQGKVKSPINLGLMTTPEIEELPEEKQPTVELPAEVIVKQTGMPWDGCIPPSFEVIQDKQSKYVLVYSVVIEKESETGEKVPTVVHVPFTHDIFWFGQWAEAGDSNDTAQVTVHLWTGDYVRTYLMDQSLVASPFKLLEFLAGKAIHTTNHKRAPQAMQDYAKGLLQRIKSTGKRPKIDDHLGMRILPDGQLVCAHGAHIIFGDGHIEAAQLSPALRAVSEQFPLPIPGSFSGEWEPEVFDTHILPRAKKHIEFLRQYYGSEGMERFQLAIMLGLASPFMPFIKGEFVTGSALPKQSSLSVSLYSRQSARGKTTAVSSAILAYGKPSELANDSGKTGATDNARFSRLSIHGTMPNIMDEMGGATAQSVAQIVSSVANGASKERSTKDGGLSSAPAFSLINLMTTNTSQRDMISAVQDNSGAIQYRLLEINVEDMPEYDQELRDGFSKDWAFINQNCVGALGAMIHRAICAMGIAGVNKLVMECSARAASRIGADQNARFQYWGLGAVFALHVVLSKMGMQLFDLQKLVDTFKAAYDAGNAYINQNVLPSDNLELLRRALTDLAPHTIITEGETHVNPHTTKFDEPLNARVPDTIHARHIKCTRRTYLSQTALREWCHAKGISEHELIKDARKTRAILTRETKGMGGVTYKASAEYFNLTKGMRANMNLRVRCYVVDTRRLFGLIGVDSDTWAEGGNVVSLHGGETAPETSETPETTGT